jgi:hypothetical protein
VYGRGRKNNKKIRNWIDGFVDDTSLFTNLDYGKRNLEQLKKRGKYDGQLWEGLLSTSGGELELQKCFYYILSWKWDHDGNAKPENIKEQ